MSIRRAYYRLERQPTVAGVMAHVSPFRDVPSPTHINFNCRAPLSRLVGAPSSNHVAWWGHLFKIAGIDAPVLDRQLSGWGVMENDPERKMSPVYFNTGVLFAPVTCLSNCINTT